MATITVRQLNASWDSVRGNGLACFLEDIDAVAQIIETTLKLWQGEWWENLNAGVPYLAQALGQSGSARQQQIFALSLQQAILGINNSVGIAVITGVTNVTVNFNPTTSVYSFTAVAQTIFGPITVKSSSASSIG